MNNLTVPTPITDKNGKQTTVHKKNVDSATGKSRIAALNAKEKPEKLTAIAPPKYGYYNALKDSDVIEVGAKKPLEINGHVSSTTTQNVYLNGKVIASLSSEDETQHRNIAGSRLISYGSEKKVWRASGKAPSLGNNTMNKYLSSSEFSRSKAVYDIANRHMLYSKLNEKYAAYIDAGGINFTRSEDNANWVVSGTNIDIPKDMSIRIHQEPGHIATSVILRSLRSEWHKAELHFDEINRKGAAYVSFGSEKFSFSFNKDGSFLPDDDNGTPNTLQQGIIDKSEQFSKDVFSAVNDRG